MEDRINLNHGAGGRAFDDLFHEVFLPVFDNKYLRQMSDGSILGQYDGKLVLTTDSFVVSPRIFPGGSLGKLAFCGTVNDLAVMGAKPLYLTLGLIIEEGFSLEELRSHMQDIADLCYLWDIPVVTGDTKVVERGHGDGLFINTTGLGGIAFGQPSPNVEKIAAGDKIIINGCIGNHGIAVLSQRSDLNLKCQIESDCAPLHMLATSLWKSFPDIRCMRDPTRGGLASVLNEIASCCRMEFNIFENLIPIEPAVASVCELMGFEPLQLANEGKIVVIAPSEQADDIVASMKSQPYGENSQIIGEVCQGGKFSMVRLTTCLGGERIVPWPSGEQMPRIC
ncbi:MAG: hydrogenase expression/formation protein HypE [Bdellovibrionota bacterium]